MFDFGARRSLKVVSGWSALSVAFAAGALSFLSDRAEAEPPRAAAPVTAPAAPAAAPETPTAPSSPLNVVTFLGTCDASGAVELDAQRFAVVDDEDNVIRIYDADRGGAPLETVDVSSSLALVEPRGAESDFEAAARIGGEAYFLSSHARTRSGKRDPDRLLFFATSLPKSGAATRVVGVPYKGLLDDLKTHPELAAFGLEEAANKPPKVPGGLNLEGLTALENGGLLIGFRSPVPHGKALVVTLANPREVVQGARANLRDPRLLDLGGLGVRALSSWQSQLLIAAGPAGDGGPFRVYWYDGALGTQIAADVDLSGFAVEGFFTPETRDRVLLLSDDGMKRVDGRACKKLKDPSRKSFRGVWVPLQQASRATAGGKVL